MKNRNPEERKTRVLFWLLAIALGALQAWGNRYFMDLDGVSYLDHGDAFFRGEWGIAVNPYWGPLYSFLLGLALFVLKPSPYWEYPVVHFVNFLIYVGALGSFEFFLRQLIRHHEIQKEKLAEEGHTILPSSALRILAYSVFIWSSLTLINLQEVTPDMLVALFVYLASGVLLRICRGEGSWPLSLLLGGILGLGYLAKSVMFPLSGVFLGVLLFRAGKPKKALPQTMGALLVFLLIASPYIFTVSRAMGRLTISESGRLHYLWCVNQVYPDYPDAKKIFDSPPVLEFRTPIPGTFPIWFDPAYWNRNLAPNYFDPKGLVKMGLFNGKRYYSIFFLSQSYFTISFLLLLYMSRGRRFALKSLGQNGVFLLPAFAALGLYALAPLFTRYIASFIALSWLGLFSGVRLPPSHASRRLLIGVSLSLVTMMSFQIAREEFPLVRSTLREILKGGRPADHPMWLVARHLNRMGLKPGDPVASIGSYFHAFWARLARVRIIAQIHHTDSLSFWTQDPDVQSQVLKAFQSTGAKMLVAERVPGGRAPEGWQRIEDTDFFVRPLAGN